MARRLYGGALATAGLVAQVARHVAWYVGYQLDGRTRDAPAGSADTDADADERD